MKLLGILALLTFSVVTAQAKSYVCHADIDSTTRRTIVIGEAFLACESPKSVELKSLEMKAKYCVGSMFVITSAGNQPSMQEVHGMTTASVLNTMPSDIGVIFTYSESAPVNGRLKLSKALQVSSPAINVPTDSQYSCKTL